MKITMNRPEMRNTQSRIMLEEFDDALMKALDDESVRARRIAHDRYLLSHLSADQRLLLTLDAIAPALVS